MQNNYLKIHFKGIWAALFLIFLFVSLNAQEQVTVTLRVDMTGTGFSEAYVTGTFAENNGWSILPMTQEGESDVYFIELELAPGVLETYYFLSANDWGARETVPEACWGGEWDNHRGFTVPEEDVTYGYMFGSCDPVGSETPDPVENFDITLRVDMTGVDVSNGVFVTGTITAPSGGDWSYLAMDREGETEVYSVTVSLPEGSYTYVFWRHNNWDDAYRETVPEECALSGEIADWDTDRLLVVADQDETIGYMFGSCDPVGTSTSVDVREINNLVVFPVPAKDELFINYPASASGVLVNVYSLNGQQVLSVDSRADTGQVKLDVSSLSKGIYVVEVITSTGVITKKVNIE